MNLCLSCAKEGKPECPLPEGVGGIITTCSHHERYCKGDCGLCARECGMNQGGELEDVRQAS